MIINLDIPQNKIQSLLCSALEGGSNYWYVIERFDFAPELSETDFAPGGTYYDDDFQSSAYTVPFVEGCAMVITSTEEDEREEYRLDRESIKKGLELMANTQPIHFGDFLAENDDADTADVFLQLCLFGDVIYG